MKIRLDQNEGIDAGKAIEVEAHDRTPSGRVSLTIWNGAKHAKIALTAKQAQQVSMALIAAFGGGGDAG